MGNYQDNKIYIPPVYQPIYEPVYEVKNKHKNERKECPKCGYLFLYSNQREIEHCNKHIKSCQYKKPNPLPEVNNLNYNNNNNNNNNKKPKMIGSLVLTDSLNAFLNDGKVELPRGKKDGTFEEKVDYLRYDISKKKVDFTEGSETLYISRENVFENSFIQIPTFNIYKEIKIIFIGEESSDAGGLIREWLTILFKQILDEKTGLKEAILMNLVI